MARKKVIGMPQSLRQQTVVRDVLVQGASRAQRGDQYTLATILGIWALAAVPMGVLSWVITPRVALGVGAPMPDWGRDGGSRTEASHRTRLGVRRPVVCRARGL